jgi:PAS domain S-box-containing protein
MPVEALRALGGDVEGALEHINVPSYVVDSVGVVRWLNKAARRLVGDQVGRQFTSVVHPDETRRAREIFARNLLGNTPGRDSSVSVIDNAGARLAVDISSVQLRDGDRVIGMFGQVTDVVEEPVPHPELHLTPRQAEILRLLELGMSTDEIAERLHLSRETVRNHVRRLLHAVGAKSRLEAVALARGVAARD